MTQNASLDGVYDSCKPIILKKNKMKQRKIDRIEWWTRSKILKEKCNNDNYRFESMNDRHCCIPLKKHVDQCATKSCSFQLTDVKCYRKMSFKIKERAVCESLITLMSLKTFHLFYYALLLLFLQDCIVTKDDLWILIIMGRTCKFQKIPKSWI